VKGHLPGKVLSIASCNHIDHRALVVKPLVVETLVVKTLVAKSIPKDLTSKVVESIVMEDINMVVKVGDMVSRCCSLGSIYPHKYNHNSNQVIHWCDQVVHCSLQEEVLNQANISLLFGHCVYQGHCFLMNQSKVYYNHQYLVGLDLQNWLSLLIVIIFVMSLKNFISYLSLFLFIPILVSRVSLLYTHIHTTSH